MDKQADMLKAIKVEQEHIDMVIQALQVLEDASTVDAAVFEINIQECMLALRSACEKLSSNYGVIDKDKTSVFLNKLTLVVDIYQQMVQHCMYPRF